LAEVEVLMVEVLVVFLQLSLAMVVVEVVNITWDMQVELDEVLLLQQVAAAAVKQVAIIM
jgi:hypothetical protein